MIRVIYRRYKHGSGADKKKRFIKNRKRYLVLVLFSGDRIRFVIEKKSLVEYGTGSTGTMPVPILGGSGVRTVSLSLFRYRYILSKSGTELLFSLATDTEPGPN